MARFAGGNLSESRFSTKGAVAVTIAHNTPVGIYNTISGSSVCTIILCTLGCGGCVGSGPGPGRSGPVCAQATRCRSQSHLVVPTKNHGPHTRACDVFGISGHIGEAEHAQHCVSSAFSLVLGDADAVITFQSHNRATHAHGGGELFQFEQVTRWHG
jgi:hypothetical protein